jgi:glycoside/pentoside/hexuronide:cation symporter, GPH family
MVESGKLAAVPFTLERPRMTQSNGMPPARERVPLGQKASWAAGSIADQVMTNGINNLALPIYNISLGVSPVLIGYALALPRIFDAVTDPIMGNISDNTRTPWGRRRPYIFLGSFFCAITFALLWIPPLGFGATGLFLYFLLMSILYYTAYTVLAVPRTALGYEMCTDYNERTTLFAMNAIFASLAGFGIPWLYKLSFHPVFAGPEKNEIVGVRWVAVLAGILILLTCLPGALFTRERAAAMRQPRISLPRAVRLTLSSGPFLNITGIVVLILLAVMLVGPMNLYINIFYICGGDKEAGAFWGGWAGMTQALSGLLATPLIAWVSRHIGKRVTIFCGLWLAVAGYLASWWLFNPAYPWLQVFFMVMLQPGLMTVWVLSGSILADICDFDELENGLRREGMFGAAYTLITKIASASITILAGYMLVWAGYRDGATITPETVTNLRVLFIAVPVVLLGLALALTWRFPITEKVARGIRAELDARAAAAGAPGA